MNKLAKEIRDMSEQEFEEFCKRNMNEPMHTEESLEEFSNKVAEDLDPEMISKKVSERVKENNIEFTAGNVEENITVREFNRLVNEDKLKEEKPENQMFDFSIDQLNKLISEAKFKQQESEKKKLSFNWNELGPPQYGSIPNLVTPFTQYPYNNMDIRINYTEKFQDSPKAEEQIKQKPTAYTFLQEAAETYKSRNLVYKDTYKRTGPVLEKLFPNGITVTSADDFNRLTIFITMVSKMIRYSTDFSKGHDDSMLDIGAYSAMLRELDSEK